jgi:hypothetical protein
MIRTKMNYWQLTQLFLSDTGVHEVEMNVSTDKLRCTCVGFDSRSQCKHIRFVKTRMQENGGIYPTEVSKRASKLDTIIASRDPKLFRKLLIDYGKIEVI